MGARKQQVKAKVAASRTRASKSTGSSGVAQKAKGKTQQAVGKARRTVKKAT